MRGAFKNKGRVYEYDIMRVILTILVVIGHAAYLNMPFGFGGVDYTSSSSLGNCLSTNWYAKLYKIVGIVYFFHMPAFFFVSGAVFNIGMNNGKYSNLEKLVENKSKRLLFSAITAGVFWMVPLKFFGNGYSSAKVLPYAFFKGIYLGQGTGHLWYLFTLFWIFLISYICLKYFIKENWLSLLSSIFIIGTFYNVIDFSLPGGNNLLYYLQFFLVGYCFEKNRANCLVTYKKLTILGILAVIVAGVSYHFTSTVVTTGMFFLDWLKTLGIVAYTIVLFCLCHLLGDKVHFTNCRFYKVLEKHDFNIYLLHDPLNYAIMAVFAKILKGADYSIVNWTKVSIGLSFFRIIANIVICIIISVCIHKMKLIKVGWILAIIGIISLIIIYYNSRYGITVEMNVYIG